MFSMPLRFMSTHTYNKSSVSGFTLVELLLVVTLIGILAGVTISVINPKRQQDFASDGVRKSNVEKLVQAIESYCSTEPTCPAVGDLNDSNSTLRKVYLNQAPPSGPTETYTYAVSGTDFILYVSLASDTSRYWKYYSGWGDIRECGSSGIGTIGSACAP